MLSLQCKLCVLEESFDLIIQCRRKVETLLEQVEIQGFMTEKV